MGATPAATGVVRVSAASATRRVDLVLPGAVPVAELVPELARSLGLLTPAAAYAGYRLLSPAGRELDGDRGLLGQGVEDGALLTVAARADDAPVRVHDDVVDAVGEVVDDGLVRWDATAGRRAALGAAVLGLGLGAVALLLERDSAGAGPAAAVAAAASVSGAGVLSRLRRGVDAAAVLVWAGVALAAVAGAAVAPRAAVGGSEADVAGAAMVVTGLAALIGLSAGRCWTLPPTVLGAVLLAAGGLSGAVSGAVRLETTTVVMSALVVVVLVGGAFPWLAVGVVREARPGSTAGPVDVDRLAVDARLAREIVLSASLSVGLVVLVAAPISASRGPAGVVLGVLSCVVVLLRARHHHAAAEVLVALVTGLGGLAGVAAAVLWLHPHGRPIAAAALLAAGAVAVVAALRPPSGAGRGSARRRWIADLGESAALLALLPLLVVATGGFAAIRG